MPSVEVTASGTVFGNYLVGRFAGLELDTRTAADSLLTALRADPDQPDLLIICRSGGRSGMACGGLGDNAINVDGGMLAWEAAGLPTR